MPITLLLPMRPDCSLYVLPLPIDEAGTLEGGGIGPSRFEPARTPQPAKLTSAPLVPFCSLVSQALNSAGLTYLSG